VVTKKQIADKEWKSKLDRLCGNINKHIERLAEYLVELERRMNALEFRKVPEYLRLKQGIVKSRFEILLRVGRGEIPVDLVLKAKLPEWALVKIDTKEAKRLANGGRIRVASEITGEIVEKSIEHLSRDQLRRAFPRGAEKPVPVSEQIKDSVAKNARLQRTIATRCGVNTAGEPWITHPRTQETIILDDSIIPKLLKLLKQKKTKVQNKVKAAV